MPAYIRAAQLPDVCQNYPHITFQRNMLWKYWFTSFKTLVSEKVNNWLFRTEKDNVSIKHEIEEIKIVSDEVTRAKVEVLTKEVIVFWKYFWICLVIVFFACKCFSIIPADRWKRCDLVLVSNLCFSPSDLFILAPFTFDEHIYLIVFRVCTFLWFAQENYFVLYFALI